MGARVEIVIASWLALVLAAGCTSSPPTSLGGEHPQVLSRYRATFTEPCGRGLLSLRATEHSPAIEVQVVGDNNPIRQLRYPVLVGTELLVAGYMTGAAIDDHHCGTYPAFHVTSFEPVPPVKRLVSVHSLDASFHRYVEHLPADRLVASDHESYRGSSPWIDTDTCTERTGSCPSPTRLVRDADHAVYCCRVNDL